MQAVLRGADLDALAIYVILRAAELAWQPSWLLLF